MAGKPRWLNQLFLHTQVQSGERLELAGLSGLIFFSLPLALFLLSSPILPNYIVFRCLPRFPRIFLPLFFFFFLSHQSRHSPFRLSLCFFFPSCFFPSIIVFLLLLPIQSVRFLFVSFPSQSSPSKSSYETYASRANSGSLLRQLCPIRRSLC